MLAQHFRLEFLLEPLIHHILVHDLACRAEIVIAGGGMHVIVL